jgi:hypothetical protein
MNNQFKLIAIFSATMLTYMIYITLNYSSMSNAEQTSIIPYYFAAGISSIIATTLGTFKLFKTK